MRNVNKRNKDAAERAARNEVLLTEEPGFVEAEGVERTYHFKQKDLASAVDISSANKVRRHRHRAATPRERWAAHTRRGLAHRLQNARCTGL